MTTTEIIPIHLYECDIVWKRNSPQKSGQLKTHTNSLKKQLLICLFLFSVGVWLLLQTEIDNKHQFFIPEYLELRSNHNLAKGSGCHIPMLDEYDPSILSALIEEDTPPNCGNSTGILVNSNLTHLFLNPSVKAKLNYKGSLHCCYRPFSPSSTDKSGFRYFKKCKAFSNEVVEQFVRVECRVNSKLIHKDFFSFMPSNYRHKARDIVPKKNISVLILGIDALSRLNFKRQMKDTYSFLTKKINAAEFLGYNKVDDNTFPNLMPVLAGKSELELSKSCWPNYNYTFDNCLFIWDYFKKAGFTTGFGEDASWMGIFEYCKAGFNENPTDLYLKIFNHVSEMELGHEKRLNANICVGAKLNIEVLLDSIKKFVLSLIGKLFFGFFWENSLSHDFLNLPKYGDHIHRVIFEEFFEKQIFEQTMVIIMSDHGIRWGTIRSTYQGYMEERLPLLMISSPQWFRQTFPLAWANLKKNNYRLTTPYDLHETLQDLRNLALLENDVIQERSKALRQLGNTKMPRGISLFLPIPLERTCQDANIDEHWCTCHKDINISINGSVVIKASNFIINHINSFLKGYNQCSRLNISSIISARLKVLPSNRAPKEVKNYDLRIKDYTISLKAEPGGGLFEACVQESSSSQEFRLIGSISRSNTYGNSSHCVSNYKLKLYCHCK